MLRVQQAHEPRFALELHLKSINSFTVLAALDTHFDTIVSPPRPTKFQEVPANKLYCLYVKSLLWVDPKKFSTYFKEYAEIIDASPLNFYLH